MPAGIGAAVPGGSITLKGSANIVTEFFGYGVNTILYQRGVYPPEQFERNKKYGLTLLTTTDAQLKKYLNGVLSQLSTWLYQKTVQKVIVVIANASTGETVERWQFDIECDKSASDTTLSDKPIKEVQGEIQAIIRQITASVSFLPMIEESCTFEMLVYTDKDAETPLEWQESDAKLVKKGRQVMPLRQFSTNIHTVKPLVSYRTEE